ncbi:hypothetical protein [Desertivirga arenae]|uniref:hypothetical protein n=1 Tax=Desertivirga arenae TaxID=2810309 RepID=UPI001A958677|nr:hypothetical protein [Pedobacter sp. SYSU D00823]
MYAFAKLLLPSLVLNGIICHSCNSASTAPVKHEKAKVSKKPNVISQQPKSTETEISDENPDDWAEYYVLMADTGQNYQPLQKAMKEVSHLTNIKIDTLNRSFRADKNLIALADDDEDEMYAGDYFPRRFQGNFLSIEYLSSYLDDAPEKTMVLIAGIYDNKASADSAFQVISSKGVKVQNRKTKMFIGCLH